MMVGMEGEAMAAAASSECSSGCQSGWTMYLDHSSCNTDAPYKKQPFEVEETEEEEEDDLSMISDASSGPPLFADHHDEQYDHHKFWCVKGTTADDVNDGARRRTKQAEAVRRRQKEMAAASLLDDTASSPPFKYSKVVMSSGAVTDGMPNPRAENAVVDFSCASSATSFKSPLGSHLGYLQMQSPAPIKPTPTRPLCRDGGDKKRWWMK